MRNPDGSPIGGVVVDVATPSSVFASIYLALDSDGSATMPPPLAGHDLTFHRLGHQPAKVSDWDGGPLVVDLIHCDSDGDCSQMYGLPPQGTD